MAPRVRYRLWVWKKLINQVSFVFFVTTISSFPVQKSEAFTLENLRGPSSGSRGRNLNNETTIESTAIGPRPNIPGNRPIIEEASEQTIMLKENDEKSLSCTVIGVQDSSNITWTHSSNKSVESMGLKWSTGSDEGKFIKYLNIPSFNFKQVGDYFCTARNNFGEARIKFHLELAEPVTNGPIIAVTITVIGVTLFIVCLFYEFFIKKKNGLTKNEIDAFKNGNLEAMRKNGYAHENANYAPYNQDMELKDKLYVDKKDILGTGAFGIVVRGKLNRQTVAIKMPKPGADKVYMKSMLSELKVMIYIGKHPNVVNLIGASTKDLRKGTLYIVVDCCSLGSLEQNLKEHRDNFFNIFAPGATAPTLKQGPGISGLCTNDLILWAYQIARAMEYLTTKKVIHGDLATRNVLLAERGCCKITDFGLSRKLYEYSNYVKKNQEPLPWRWMAFESLGEFSFSSKSDVWSYGVVLWELFSLAEIPYPGMNWTNEFVDQLGRGLRLAHPKYASAELYALMQECWRLDPELRPNFQTLKETFEELKSRLASQEPKYVRLDGEAEESV